MYKIYLVCLLCMIPDIHDIDDVSDIHPICAILDIHDEDSKKYINDMYTGMDDISDKNSKLDLRTPQMPSPFSTQRFF